MSGDHNMHQKPRSYLDDFECPRCGHCCPQQTEQEPVAWRYALDASVEGPRWIYIDKDPHQWLQGPAMVNAAIEELHTSPQPSKPWVGLTEREVELIDEMIETQLLHAERCDHIANSTMAQKQKAWDLERVELLRKLKERNT